MSDHPAIVYTPEEVARFFYGYDPSYVAAIVFTCLFGVLLISSAVQFHRYKAWGWFAFLGAAKMETFGYLGRILSILHPIVHHAFAMQYSVLFLAPNLISGSCYLVFGRIIYLVVPREHRTSKICWVPPRFVTPLFVALTTLSLFLQLGGMVMLNTGDPRTSAGVDRIKSGRNLTLSALALQIFTMVMYAIVALKFKITSKQFANPGPSHPLGARGMLETNLFAHAEPVNKNWKALLRVVNLVHFLILIRTVYRVLALTGAGNKYVKTHEWCLYAFDAAPMFLCIILLSYWHPSLYLPYMGLRLPSHVR